jgi:hypothetical protein
VSECNLAPATIRRPRPAKAVEPWKKMIFCNVRFHVVWQIATNGLHKPAASIFGVEIKFIYNTDGGSIFFKKLAPA